jgi:IS1 family transposase
MANILSREKQLAAINCLVEGSSVRSAERLTGVHRDTIIRLMVRVGDGCQRLMDRELRNLNSRRIEVDEVWGYVAKKQRQVKPSDNAKEVGDYWTFVAMDAESKLVPSFITGKRDRLTTRAFMMDLQSRLAGRVQLSTDAFNQYVDAVDAAFGANVDYGQIVKFFEGDVTKGSSSASGRYSPAKVVRIEKSVVWGNPDPKFISTSHVERSNLSMRMGMRRLTRLTNAFSKRAENFTAAVRLYFAHYNYVRIHRSLRVTPVMAAGISNKLWSLDDLLNATLDA